MNAKKRKRQPYSIAPKKSDRVPNTIYIQKNGLIGRWDGKGWKCEHDRQRSRCKECGGSQICPHDRLRSQCKECGGSQICPHDRRRSECKECDPCGHLTQLMRSRCRRALRSKNAEKNKSVLENLRCTVEHFHRHIESMFTDGMTWENMGTKEDGTYGWDLDHRRPCNSFDLTNEEEKEMCFHYTNIQPLWHVDNVSKGTSHDPETFPYMWEGCDKGWKCKTSF